MISSAALAQMHPPRENQIHVEIVGLRNDQGQALCALFSTAGDFPQTFADADTGSPSAEGVTAQDELLE